MEDELKNLLEDELKNLNELPTFVEVPKEMDDADLYPFPTNEEVETKKRFLGMTPAQLFVISIELFFMILIFGLFFMVVTEKIVLPF